MSKTKHNNRKQKPNAAKKKKQFRWYYVAIPVLLILVIGAGFALNHMLDYTQNYATRMSEEERTEYNSTLSLYAFRRGHINNNEILLVKHVDLEMGGDTTVELCIYKLPKGTAANDFMHMCADDVTADSKLEYVGTASCKLAGGDLKSLYNFQSHYIL